MATTIIRGLLVDCDKNAKLRTEDGILVVKGEKVLEKTKYESLDNLLSKYKIEADSVISLSESQFLMPGLIDTHIHAPQFPNAGLALDLTLLDWLQRYTFPTEEKMSDLARAEEVYARCVRSTLDSGTTTASYFGTIHLEACILLAKICKSLGQRALIGKVNMDRNSPPTYCEDTEESLRSTNTFIEAIRKIESQLIKPIITPRFVPSCSRDLMMELGKMAKNYDLNVQTHLSENLSEVQWVSQLEPDCQNYTDVYKKCNLLGPKTMLAHCCHLSEPEIKILATSGSGVAHCPNSNFSLKSGVCDVKRLWESGVKVGLGTDVAGGFSPSILNTMRMAVMASNTLTFSQGRSGFAPLGFSDALYLATRGGAGLLDMEDDLGALEPGMQADMILVDMDAHNNTRLFGTESTEDIVSKFVFLADDRNISKVWVAGKCVKDIVKQK